MDSKVKKVYIIGIKGSGVIGIVEILKSMGVEVTGSDTEEKFFTDEILQKLGIKYYEGFAAKNVPEDTDLVIYSTAYNENNNEEFRRAKELRLVMVSYPEVIAQLFNEKYGIAVCGTHGKTTTTGWLANTLRETGLDPTAMVGSKVINWGGNVLVGNGEYCVLEADEYQNKLSLYSPKIVLLLSCDFDHPDYFENFSQYKNTFKDFVERIPKTGFLVVWGDSADTLEVAQAANCETLSYGFSEDASFKIINYQLISTSENKKTDKPMQSFELEFQDQSLGRFEIQLVGKHNVLNAAAVITTCYKMQIPIEKVRKAIRTYQGTARRFEYMGSYKGAILIDDYGHHPDEIKPTLKAAREVYPGKTIWAVFHPHTFTRTKALLSEFSQSFDDADKVIVLDIYGSAREQQGGVHSEDLVELINRYSNRKAEYIATIPEVVAHLKNEIGENDVVICIGAGNVWEVADKLKEK